ncbi:MerR family regulatory protein [Streptomyces sp. WMMB 714]|uniref:transcriptional regulator FtsR n=1 Tax=Streptomyces sp. WMMB 714 TaxID=1286822 RepID=UPI0005F7C0DE|nr:MerR family transcriptional regulator [Streptomyces sp. WMMB 714]SCK52449.1 MerR family regulatory protein [Streptomyces sp. WMMB 714]
MERTPSGGAGGGTAPDQGSGPMGIGAVLDVLREEFPEVTVSKIRFLEAEGLVEPRRTPSGHRMFGAEDVRRLSFILRMQRDHYLPLRVIREQFDSLTDEEVRLADRRGNVPPHGRTPVGGALVPDAVSGDAPVGREELLRAAGLSAEDLAECEASGLITPDDAGVYGPEAVGIARLVARIRRSGADPRHLRALRSTAERDAETVRTILAAPGSEKNPALGPEAGPRARPESGAAELVALSLQLHAALVHSALRLRSR